MGPAPGGRLDPVDSLAAGPLEPGLCSVTFRGRPVPEVVEVAAAAGLSAIEWGGDVHVPHGDLRAAADAAARSRAAGLSVVSYGSYLCCDATSARRGRPTPETSAVLDTAEALGAPWVRVWCPFGVEPGAGPAEVDGVASALQVVAVAAAERGLGVYLEFHGGTLTADVASAVSLLGRVGSPEVACAWQAPYWAPEPLAAEVADLESLGPWLAHLHVYAWDADGTRQPLAQESDRWPARLAAAAGPEVGSALAPELAGRARVALLEFVADDDPEHLVARCRHASGLAGRAR